MDILLISLTGLILVCLLAFRFQAEQSRFEINNLAEHNKKYRQLSHFLDIYPGLSIFVHVVALITSIILTGLSVNVWGLWGGGAIAFGAILLSWLLGRMLHGVAASLIGSHLDFFNRYFAWTGILSKLVIASDEPHIGSEAELMHLIHNGDFLDDDTKDLIKNTIDFKDKAVKSVMTPRANIGFIHSRDHLTPKLLDELFSSGYKIFPVINNSIDHTVGFLYLDDVLPIDQHEKVLADVIRKAPPPVDQTAPLEAALKQMAEYHSSVLLVEKDGKVVGLVTMTDIVRSLFGSHDL